MHADTRTPRATTAWSLFVIGLLAALGTSYGAYQLAGYSWDQVVDYQSPFLEIDPASTRVDNPGEDQRTVLVIIDGLTDEASRSMSAMERLRARGADVSLTVPEPSLSFPTWTTILSGAPQQISGVTTNWYERRVEVETLLDVAMAEGRSTLVAGPTDLDMLYGASAASASSFTDWDSDTYMSSGIVNDALRMDEELDGAGLVIVLLPDIDEAGHAHGAASPEYAEMVATVNADLERLIEGLDDGETVFCITPDHGHTATGGHGGWEDPVIHTSCVFVGPGVRHTSAQAELGDIAPTVAVLAGLPTPGHAHGLAIVSVLAQPDSPAVGADLERASLFARQYAPIVQPSAFRCTEKSMSAIEIRVTYAAADVERLDHDRSERLPVFVGVLAILLAFAILTGVRSWRAAVAAVVGAIAYFAVYNGLYFWAHGYTWSLSAFNEESMVQTFFNGRMAEAVIAGLVACLVAGAIYPLLRRHPKPPKHQYLAGWLSLGVATTLTIQAALVLQVAVFWRTWGAAVVWRLPDMRAGFKYDLDLIQLTALGAVAVLGPVVTYLVGRVHPRIRKTAP
ncbi:MAG: alkaline phosphatase family protein [Coriobacteriia bacterium]|nr:alkaline phosphatase family protein [Coriobacteriia bacterium]